MIWRIDFLVWCIKSESSTVLTTHQNFNICWLNYFYRETDGFDFYSFNRFTNEFHFIGINDIKPFSTEIERNVNAESLGIRWVTVSSNNAEIRLRGIWSLRPIGVIKRLVRLRCCPLPQVITISRISSRCPVDVLSYFCNSFVKKSNSFFGSLIILSLRSLTRSG